MFNRTVKLTIYFMGMFAITGKQNPAPYIIVGGGIEIILGLIILFFLKLRGPVVFYCGCTL